MSSAFKVKRSFDIRHRKKIAISSVTLIECQLLSAFYLRIPARLFLVLLKYKRYKNYESNLMYSLEGERIIRLYFVLEQQNTY